MIITVTLNPAIDQTVLVDSITVGETNRIKESRLDPGGKGVNCARVLRELNVDTVATGFAPGALGRYIEQTLSDLGALCDFVHTRGQVRMNMTIRNVRRNTSTMIVNSGPETEPRYIQQLFTRIRRHAHEGDWMVVAGSIPPPLSPRVYFDLIQLGRSLGLHTVLDADGEPLSAGVEAKPEVVKANRRELGRLLRRTLNDEQEAIEALADLRAAEVSTAVITRGREGALGMDAGGCWRALPPRIHQSTPVGAGDAFLAGLVKVFSEGGQLPDGLRLATAAGAAAAITEGTQLARWSDVESFLPRVRIQQVSVTIPPRVPVAAGGG